MKGNNVEYTPTKNGGFVEIYEKDAIVYVCKDFIRIKKGNVITYPNKYTENGEILTHILK